MILDNEGDVVVEEETCQTQQKLTLADLVLRPAGKISVQALNFKLGIICVPSAAWYRLARAKSKARDTLEIMQGCSS